MIRDATPRDAVRLLVLFRGYADFYESEPPDAGLAALIAEQTGADRDRAFLIVAEAAGEVVGFAHCQWKWSSLRGARIPFLDDLYVAEEARGRGHADALIEACRERAKAVGAPAVEWLTGTDNRRAHKVYDRVGGKRTELIEYELEA